MFFDQGTNGKHPPRSYQTPNKKQRGTPAYLKVTGVKGDVKILHLVSNTEGPKCDSPCAPLQTPQKLFCNDQWRRSQFFYPDRFNQSYFVRISENQQTSDWSLFGEVGEPFFWK